MKKRILPALLILCMTLALLPETAMAAYSGLLQMKPTNAVRYIDRVELPDYALKLYETLEEAADGDGWHDYLIDDKYFDLSGNFDSSYTGEPGDFKRLKFSSSAEAFLMVTSIEAPAAEEEKEYVYDCIRTVCAAFRRDHPEVFWLNKWIVQSYTRSGRTYFMCTLRYHIFETSVTVDMRIPEFQPGGGLDIREVMTKRDSDVEKILRTIPAGADRYTQIYYLNKWLTENNQYNIIVRNGLDSGVSSKEIDHPWDSTECVSALAGQKGAAGPECGGYAQAFQVLCDNLDIPCVLVRYDHVETAHTWNYVQMEDGKWYAVDVDLNDKNDDSANLTKYLLVGGKTVINGKAFLVSHPAENPVFTNGIAFPNGPVLSDTAYDGGPHLSYDGLPETISPGDPVSMTPILLGASAAAYTYSSSGLPAGLTLDPRTGKITGTVADAPVAQTVTVTAANPANPSDTAGCTLRFTAAKHAPAFTDVPDWCAGAANWAAKQNIAQGYGDEVFGPDDLCSEVQILTFLWRAAGKPQAAASPFTVEEYYQGAVDWACEKGLIDTSFRPGADCTRAGAVTYIWQAFGSPDAAKSAFTDVPAGANYVAVSWAVETGITNGFPGNVFNPGDTCTRGQIVTFLHRAYVPEVRVK